MILNETLAKILDKPRAYRTSLVTSQSPLRKKMVCLCSDQLLVSTSLSNKIKENRKKNIL